MLLHSAATALLQRPHTKQSAGFPLPDWEDVSAAASQDFLISAPEHIFGRFLAFSYFLFSAERFHHSLPLCGHLSFFPENQKFQILTSALCFTAFCGLFLFSEETRRYLYRESSECSNRESCRLFSKTPRNAFYPRIIRNRPSSFLPAFFTGFSALFPPPAPFRWPGTSVPRRRRNCRDIRLPPEHRRYRPA